MAHFDGCYIKIHFETLEFLVAPFCKFVLKVTRRKQELCNTSLARPIRRSPLYPIGKDGKSLVQTTCRSRLRPEPCGTPILIFFIFRLSLLQYYNCFSRGVSGL